jgi:glycosyltransferase involved in cell wall biosynthesis
MATTYPKISIVTPSFNQGKFIEETILSIINQNYPNLEYIIDGGSTDETINIIKKYEKFITYWVSEKDNGQSHALNKGLAKCTGDIFNWINSDDYLELGALELVAEKFIKTNADIVCGYTSIFDDESKKEIQKHRTQIFYNVETTLVEQRINQPAMFYSLSIIKQLGVINSKLNFVMDLELWFRYLCKFGQNKIVFLDNLISYFRIHSSSKTDSYEHKFREEEKSIWYFLAIQKKLNHKWVDYFNTNKKYKAEGSFEISAIDNKKLEVALAEWVIKDWLNFAFLAFLKQVNKN